MSLLCHISLPCALHATALLLHTSGGYGVGWKGPRSLWEGTKVMVGSCRKGILLRVFRAIWAHGYLPRRKDFLNSGK